MRPHRGITRPRSELLAQHRPHNDWDDPVFEVGWWGSIGEAGYSLTLNSETQLPIFFYEARRASATGWTGTYGPALTAAGSGGTFGLPSAVPNLTDVALDCDGTRYFTGTPTFAAVGTKDFVIQLVINNDISVTSGRVFHLKDVAGGTYEIYVEKSSSEAYRLGWNDGTGSSTLHATSTTSVQNGYNVFTWVVDRSGSTRSFCGLDRTTTAASSKTASIAAHDTLTIGAAVDGTAIMSEEIVAVGMWAFTNLGTHDQATAVKERWASIVGLKAYRGPAKFTTIVGDTRNFGTTPQPHPKWDGSKHVVIQYSDNWPACGPVQIPNGKVWNMHHMHSNQGSQGILYSNDFSNAAWTKLDAGDTLGTGVSTPQRGITSQAFVADTTDGAHGYTQSVAVTANRTHVLSVVAKAGNCTHIKIGSTTIGDYAYFNLSTGIVGTSVQGSARAPIPQIFPLGDDWYWCSMRVFNAASNPCVFSINSCAADADDTFAGDGATINTHVMVMNIQDGGSEQCGTNFPCVTTSAALRTGEDLIQWDISGSSIPVTSHALHASHWWGPNPISHGSSGSSTIQVTLCSAVNTGTGQTYLDGVFNSFSQEVRMRGAVGGTTGTAFTYPTWPDLRTVGAFKMAAIRDGAAAVAGAGKIYAVGNIGLITPGADMSAVGIIRRGDNTTFGNCGEYASNIGIKVYKKPRNPRGQNP